MSLKIDHFIPAYNEQINANLMSQTHRDHSYCANAGYAYRIRGAHGCDLISMRNRALHRSITEGFDFLFMQDSDVFSTAAEGPLKSLIGTAIKFGATLTGAAVSMRTRPPRANVWPCQVGEEFEADKLGSGMILLDLNRMRAWYEGYDGPCFQRMYKTDKCIEPHVGSDIFFCYVVRQHGGLIACNATIPTVHKDATYGHEYDGESIPQAAGEAVEVIGGLEARGVAHG